MNVFVAGCVFGAIATFMFLALLLIVLGVSDRT